MNPKIELKKGGKTVDGTFVPNQPVAPNPGFTPIALDKLNPVPAVKQTVPQTPSTGFDGLAAMYGEMANQNTASFAQDLQSRADMMKQRSDQSLESLIGATMGSVSDAAMQDQQYTSTVDPAQRELNDINNKILQEQVALQKRLDVLDKNSNGLFGGALEDEKMRIKDESLRRQTDYAVLQMAAQGKFDAAKAAADRYVQIKSAEQQKRLDVLSLLYKENKEQFTEADRRAFETAQAERQSQKDWEMYKVKAEFDQKIRQSDPLYQAQLNSANASAAKSWMEYDAAQAKVAAIASGAIMLDPDQQDTAMKLSKQYEDESKNFKVQMSAMNQIKASADDDSAAGDMGVIYGYMKLLDPNSVVRETEYATAENAAGVPERIRQQYNKALSGEKLTPEMRTQYVNAAQKIYDASSAQHTELKNQYRTQATDIYGLPSKAAEMIVRDMEATGVQQPNQSTVQNSTPEQVASMPIGSVFTVNGKQYRKTSATEAEPL